MTKPKKTLIEISNKLLNERILVVCSICLGIILVYLIIIFLYPDYNYFKNIPNNNKKILTKVTKVDQDKVINSVNFNNQTKINKINYIEEFNNDTEIRIKQIIFNNSKIINFIS
ncbi:hypothetical protein [Candidatus Phytoplasma prunorum]|uniref:hypothetical protein n=1 Tax=Candidatus Phytoplasma prunorum TaxID=47565 RepID=UPI002FF046FD